MYKFWALVLFICAVAAPCICAQSLDLTPDNLRRVLDDFSYELSQVQTETLGNAGRRRSLLSVPDDLVDLPDLDVFDLDVDVADFINGLLYTPIYDFVQELPTSNAGWEKTIKSKYQEFCKEPQKTDGDTLHQLCEGPEITIELVPGNCTVVDRDHSQFDCEPPRLEYRRTGPKCTSSHREAAEFIDKECKFVQQLGFEKELILGGGTKDTHLQFGKKKVGETPDFDVSDILDVVSSLFSDLTDFPDIGSLLD